MPSAGVAGPEKTSFALAAEELRRKAAAAADPVMRRYYEGLANAIEDQRSGEEVFPPVVSANR